MKSILQKLIRLIPGNHRILSSLQNAEEYDVAFDFDTDGDRMIMISPDGKKISGDETLTLFALNMKKTTSSLKVIFDLKASRVLIKWLQSIGIDCEICQVGSCYLDYKLRQSGAELGGEVSGHFMFKDYNIFSDDGIYSACLMLQYLSNFDNMFAMRSILPEVHVSKLMRIKCLPSTDKFELMEKIKKHIGENKIINGAAVIVQMQEGWIVIRPSETEHVLTIRCEGFYKDGLQIVQEKADSILSSVGLSIW
jgi:phosphomannomutase/phosphoglucomutase